MSFQSDSLLILRTIISDVDSPYTYTDNRLNSTILVGANFVNVDLFGDYTIILGSGVLPEPTDYNFINLTCIKSAYFLAIGEAKVAASQGIAIRDGSSSLDLKGVSQFKQAMAGEYQKMYDDAKLYYLMNGGLDGPVGAAILSPIKTYLGRYQQGGLGLNYYLGGGL